MKVLWLDTVDSTNNEARRRIESADSLSVVAAKWQTAGRGQRGNTWSSVAGENLTFSVTLKLPQDSLPAADQFAVSEASAIAVADFLSSKGISVRIKWPNDIYAGDRKICGMLIENILRGSSVASSIIGIGLNINQTGFPPGVANPVSLSMLTGRKYDIAESLEELLQILGERLKMISDGRRRELRTLYLQSMYRLGETHTYTDCTDGRVFRGTIKGISPQAKLVVEMPEGNLKEFAFKEISYII